jgi:hypothetical protein
MAVNTTISHPKDADKAAVIKCRVDTSKDLHVAIEICDELKLAVVEEYRHDDYETKGLFNQITSNLKGSYGNRIYIKSGKYSGGVCLRYCPFCGGKLMSDKEAEMVQYQIENNLAKDSYLSKN